MTNSKVIYVAPIKSGDTNVYWHDKSPFKIDSKFEYVRGMIFLDKKLLLIFLSCDDDKSSFVGRAFNYSGEVMFDVPFPEVNFRNPETRISYSWSSEINNGVKIIFGTNSVYWGDFWCDFDFETKKYIATGKAF